jgi:hypothetical protein
MLPSWLLLGLMAPPRQSSTVLYSGRSLLWVSPQKCPSHTSPTSDRAQSQPLSSDPPANGFM